MISCPTEHAIDFDFILFMGWQEEGPNDRKIGKLCDYAAKNPLRIPKVKFSFCFLFSIKVQKNVDILLCELGQEIDTCLLLCLKYDIESSSQIPPYKNLGS